MLEDAMQKIELWKDRFKREEKLREATLSQLEVLRDRVRERDRMNELLLKTNEQLSKVIQKIIDNGEEDVYEHKAVR